MHGVVDSTKNAEFNRSKIKEMDKLIDDILDKRLVKSFCGSICVEAHIKHGMIVGVTTHEEGRH